MIGAAAAVFDLPRAGARPEFARRESKACGFCHINPQGGGPRNQTGLAYARNEFKFPPRKSNLNDLADKKQRARFVAARKLVDIDHVRDARRALARLVKSVKSPAGKKLVADALHALEVRAGEILGQARLLARKNEIEEAVQLYTILMQEYREFEIYADARTDLKEISRDKEHKPLIAREQREAKARLALLDARREQLVGRKDKAQKAFRKIVKSYSGTRAAKQAAAHVEKPKPADSE